ncbi:unnamed protein product [Paramecium sonneborni]|uniref:ABC transporter domain-containing protein n=1 Tax=Paramecium sonneborni TaxID=65129 RepID=A0A8S1PPM4_9CILI|nr:unnamed protein product [Paramecium sonneborni]
MGKFVQQTKCVIQKNFYSNIGSYGELFCFLIFTFLLASINWLYSFGSSGALVFAQSYMLFPNFLVNLIFLMIIVTEKINRQKENQLIMGLKLSSYYTGWIISFFLWICINASVSMIIFLSYLALSNYQFTFYDYIMFYIQYIFFSFAYVGQTCMISSFFSNPRIAVYIYILINIFIDMSIDELLSSNQQKYLTFIISIFPQDLIFYYWIKQFNFNHKDLNDLDQITFGYTFGLFVFLVQGTIGILLFLYLDQIIPHSIGKQKSPFFICQYLFRNKKHQVDSGQVTLIQNLELQHYNSLGSELINPQDQIIQIDNNKNYVIKLFQLTKVYSGQSVVNQLSLKLNKNTIFSLLGHNGAGKSTTINMICGLIEKTSGQIHINGYDIDKNLDEIRQDLGYCSQKDILYQDMTVKQHLQFYGQLKLVNQLQLSVQIEHVLQICHLQQEQNIYVKNLSRGGKRKLCLAIALMGNSKVLLLDEPTSGLDPISRQQIYNILSEIKQDRCIILTTHYLEEAQELSDYIGIIQQGKLTVFGTADQIKKQFSIGYNILIECQNELHQNQIQDQIQATLNLICKNEILFIPQKKNLKLNIPLSNRNNMASVLEYLETVQNINIQFEMTTLEDAYIKIHSQTDWVDNQIDIDNNILLNKIFFNFTPHFDFINQVYCLFMSRIYMTGQNKRQYIIFLISWALCMGIFYFYLKYFHFYIITASYIVNKLIYISSSQESTYYEQQKNILDQYLAHGAKIISYYTSVFLFDLVVLIFEQIITIIIFLISYKIKYDNDNEYHSTHPSSTYVEYCQQYFLNMIRYQIFLTLLIMAQKCQIYAFISFYKSSRFFQFFSPCSIVCLNILEVRTFSLFIDKGNQFIGIFIPLWPLWPLFADSDEQEKSLIASIIFYFLLTNYVKYKQFQRQSSQNFQGNIQVNQVNYKIKNKTILENIDFTIQPSEIFGLLGPNGAGKTSTYEIITRKNKPNSGFVEIKNESTKVGLVPSFSPLHDDLTLVQHFKIYGQLKGLSSDKINTFIESYCSYMDLNKIQNKKAAVLTGGERRKVQIGIALIGNSSILLMDEPTAGLDPLFGQQFQQLILKTCQQIQSSIFITTNSMTEAQRICGTIGIIINGQLKFKGTLNELRQQYDNRIQLSFILKNKEDKEQLKQLVIQNLTVNIIEVQTQSEKKLTVFVDNQIIKLSQVFRFCQTTEVDNLINDFQIQQASLDQIYKLYVSQQQIDNNPQEIEEDFY